MTVEAKSLPAVCVLAKAADADALAPTRWQNAEIAQVDDVAVQI